VTPEVIKPEWFFYVAFRWLKLFSGTAAVLSMGLVVFTMFSWPFIDARIQRTRFKEASVWVGALAVALIIGFSVWEAAVAH
jgi:quinol-cytochrome oxidoreductase complex cytochrome b subunit